MSALVALLVYLGLFAAYLTPTILEAMAGHHDPEYFSRLDCCLGMGFYGGGVKRT